ncbi:MAG: hypothetical protein AAGB04_30525, partial [Pseudomonadota bacterium]
RGLFPAAQLCDLLDEKLLEKLNSKRVKVSQKEQETGYRPTFRDFFEVNYKKGAMKTAPALFISTTNLCRQGFELIDSLSDGYKDLIISDVVKASASVPIAVQPQMMSVRRDSSLGKTATLQSLALKRKTYWEEGAYVDGGVVANFPMWALLRVLRQRLFGHDEDGESIYLPDGYSFDAEEVADLDHLMSDVYSPLRVIAFKPMIHFGLQIHSSYEFLKRTILEGNGEVKPQPKDLFVDTSAEELMNSKKYFRKMIDMVVSGSRTGLENDIISSYMSKSASRISLSNQCYGHTGWNDHFLDIHKLKGAKITEMFTVGHKAASESLGSYTFSLPEWQDKFQVETDIQDTSLLQIFSNISNLLDMILDNYPPFAQVSNWERRISVQLTRLNRLYAAYERSNGVETNTIGERPMIGGVDDMVLSVRTPTIVNWTLASQQTVHGAQDPLFRRYQKGAKGEEYSLQFLIPLLDAADIGQQRAEPAVRTRSLETEMMKVGLLPFGRKNFGAVFGLLSIELGVPSENLLGKENSSNLHAWRNIEHPSYHALLQTLVAEALKVSDILTQCFAMRLNQ